MHLDTYKGNFDIVSSLNEWIKEFFHSKQKSTKPYAIIHGPSGNGKTYLVECMAKDYKVDLLRFTADDMEDSDCIDNIEKSLNLQEINTENLSKIILIDDVQYLNNKKRLYTLYETCNYPLIFITNDISGLDKEFVSEGLSLKLKRPLTSEIKEFLEEKSKELNIKCDCIDDIAKESISIRTALQGLLLGRPIIKNSPLNSMSTNLKLLSRRSLQEDLNYPTMVAAFRSLKEINTKTYQLMVAFCELDEWWHVQFFKNKDRTLDAFFINNMPEAIDLVKVEYKEKEKKVKEKKPKKEKEEFCMAGLEEKEVKETNVPSIDSFF
jgi:hypothetical protein